MGAPRRSQGSQRLTLLHLETGPEEEGARRLTLRSDRGPVECRLHEADANSPQAASGGGAAPRAGVLWVFGAGGGFGGPAGGVYHRLSRRLVQDGLTSLELDYRRAGDLVSCVADVLLGIDYLALLGCDRVALVGHSFGGAVVITAGALSRRVAAVAALSSQTYGAELAPRLSPRPLLLIHGADDDVLPPACSREIYRRAGEPKELILYPRCRHGLDGCKTDLDRDLSAWLRRVFLPAAAAEPAGTRAA